MLRVLLVLKLSYEPKQFFTLSSPSIVLFDHVLARTHTFRNDVWNVDRRLVGDFIAVRTKRYSRVKIKVFLRFCLCFRMFARSKHF